MGKQGLKRGFINRILGVPATKTPQDSDCWSFKDGVITVDLGRAPELSKPGGAIRLEGADLPERVLVFLGDDGTYRAVKNRCTHIGHRRLDPVPGQNCVQCCSVNGSMYEYDGANLKGPAPHPIKTYQVVKEDNALIIKLA
ncbi:Rieske [2Fe-2S] domain-containing protein [Desulfatibacillum alkenivorans DSM 16219]|jgi:Rieske Fe-S protein|uniref:Rieske [2Fe-2S] domain-containing protein n=1 Tax=Desulfatibacillum alkenivorans DSM 16219 TaxID=1121393 RepID=A0A1M6VI87_9BACT|nr:Rieske 2Fe-2S domain-containing protein [Desulfatibacillum alkenivorans]SHK81223.1 Rieske [2Fe-2S] domain-containing protein [Desulfatibacillum alkenivorans DSM 16219]